MSAIVGLRESIDAVDWKSVECLYGDGAELPGLLDTIRGADAEKAANALRELDRRIGGAGDAVADGAALVIPILWRIALGRNVRIRPDVVQLLSALAFCIQDWGPVEKERQGPWLTSWTALRDGRVALGYLLRDPDIDVKKTAISAVAEICDPVDMAVLLALPAENPLLSGYCRQRAAYMLARAASKDGGVSYEELVERSARMVVPQGWEPVYKGDWDDIQCPRGVSSNLPDLLARIAGEDSAEALDAVTAGVFGGDRDLCECSAVMVRELLRLALFGSSEIRERILGRMVRIVDEVAEWRGLGAETSSYWEPTWTALRNDLLAYGFLAGDAQSNIRLAAVHVMSRLAEPGEVYVLKNMMVDHPGMAPEIRQAMEFVAQGGI